MFSSAVPESIIGECGCLRKGDKSILVCKCLSVPLQNPTNPNIVLIDGNQLLYHISWPVAGTGKVANVAEGMKERIKGVHDAKKFIIFDSYETASAKEHERQRRGGGGSTEYTIGLNTMLAGREAIMKNTSNKRPLCQLLCTFDLGENTHMIGKD